MAWMGFAAGVCLLLLTGSSVIKTLLIPRNLSSLIGTFVARSVLFAFRLITGPVENLYRREKILSAGAPTFLFALLVSWLCSLYVGFALMLLPFTQDDMPNAFRLSGSSLFTLGFATPAGAAPYGIVFAAAISGLGVIALMIGYMPTIYSAYNRREILVIMLEALAGKPPWGPEVLARQQLIGNVEYLGRVYERWTEWAADISESHTTYRTLIYFRSRYAENAWPLALLAVLDAAALHLALCPDSAPAESRPLLRVGYMTLRQIGRTLRVPVNDDPHPDDPLRLSRADFDEAVQHLDAAGWVFERNPDEAWPHFRGWRVNYELAAEGIAAHLDLPQAKWSGPRARLGHARLPDRPAHREPQSADSPHPADSPLQGAQGFQGAGSPLIAGGSPGGRPPGENRAMRKYVIMGVQGSGKGTQSQLLAADLDLVHISVGDIFRWHVQRHTKMGAQVRRVMAAGELVGDDLVESVVGDRLSQHDWNYGFIIDGFPRNARQAEFFLESYDIDGVIQLDLPDSEVRRRVLNRRLCAGCGMDYNLIANSPQVPGNCDACGGELVTREDDTEEALAVRLRDYHEKTNPVLDLFRRKEYVVMVDARPAPEVVQKDIRQRLGLPPAKPGSQPQPPGQAGA